MDKNTYASAGVDIEKGDRFADFIKNIKSKAVSSGIGGFAGGIEIDTEKYKKPVLLSSTDGVGTKLLVAQKLKKFDTVGIDLVAMCVNDLIVCGAAPLVFLDYIACGKIHEEMLHDIVRGIVEGCEQAECTLAGGETAEMPDLYAEKDFDLAGFSVGIVDKDKMLPRTDEIKAGDVLLGLPSTGIHSNGLSLARKVIKEENWDLLLPPTKIYIKDMKKLIETGMVLAAAHITGGGLEGNVVRILPDNVKPEFTWDWDVPEVFTRIQEDGPVEEAEMRKVFNMGIGMTIVVKKENKDAVLDFAKKNDIDLKFMGTLNG